MVILVACVNCFHGSKHNIVYLCKQGYLWMGWEDQQKQPSLNATYGTGRERAVITMHHSKHCKMGLNIVFFLVSIYFMRCLKCKQRGCFETNHSPRGFQELIAACRANQEGHLSRWWTSEELAGAAGLCVLSMPQELNWVTLRECLKTATPGALCMCARSLDIHRSSFFLVYGRVCRLSPRSVLLPN